MVLQHGKDCINKMIDINKLPDSWETMTLQQFNKTLKVVVTDNDEADEFVIQYLTSVAIELLDVTADEIFADYKNVLLVIQRLSFFLTPPPEDKHYKHSVKLIGYDKLSYDKYVSLMQRMENMSKSLLLDDLNETIKLILIDDTIDVEQMNMMDVYQCFFLYNRLLKKYLIRSQFPIMKKTAATMLGIHKLKAIFNWKGKK